jgi:hypothetical protein
MDVPEAQRYLTSLPGVGRKTAACVLLFALGEHDVPVDELHDTMLAVTPRGQEVGVSPQPAAAWAADLPRVAAGVPGVRAAADAWRSVAGWGAG